MDGVSARAPFVGHGHHADGVLGIGVDLGLEDGRDGVYECAEARGLVVAVAHVLRVVEHDHGGLERHP